MSPNPTGAPPINPNVILTVWAVAGPLIVGLVSALFNRHVQVDDRTHADAREDLRFSREGLTRREERDVAHRVKTYEEAKAALADFMTMTHVFVRRQSEYLDHVENVDLGRAALEANEGLMRSCQLVVLIADEELEVATVSLWNWTIKMPRPAANRDKDWEAALIEYKAARSTFNRNAKRFLSTLR